LVKIGQITDCFADQMNKKKTCGLYWSQHHNKTIIVKLKTANQANITHRGGGEVLWTLIF